MFKSKDGSHHIMNDVGGTMLQNNHYLFREIEANKKQRITPARQKPF